MGFKLPEKSITSGTSAHRSALKKVSETETEIPESTLEVFDKVGTNLTKTISNVVKNQQKEKKAYGGTKTWSEGQKDSGGTLNQITKDQRKYEKEMEAKDPSWNKREDNEWKKRQNKINKHLGSSKVYDTIPDRKTKDVDGETKMKGLESNKGKTLTEEQKQDEKTNISIEKDKIKSAKSDIKTSTNKDEELDAKDKRDKSQKEIADIKSGRDNKYTGTRLSRWFNKQRSKRNQRQLDRREKNRNKNEDSPTKNMKTGKYKQKFEK
tara:strand:+ start:524 stop:1321 length:798 start_codon:yes stop_codon:yes gene_type:complete